MTQALNVIDGQLISGGLLSIIDPNAGEAAFIAGSGAPVGATLGRLSIDAAGHWSYSVANSQVVYLGPTETRVEQFVVSSIDGTEHTITVTVNGVNDAPTQPANQPNNIYTVEDWRPHVPGLIGGVTDPDGDALTYSLKQGPANGQVQISPGGTYTYVPTLDFYGSDSFVVTVEDGNGGGLDITVDVMVEARADVADDTAATTQGVSVTIDTLANDSFENPGRAITAVDGQLINDGGSPITLTNGQGTVALIDGQLQFTPAQAFLGAASFSYTVASGGATETATVAVDVQLANTAPMAVDDLATTDENTAVVIAVRGNDVDLEGDTLTISAVSQGANGSVVIDAVTGNPIYTPNAGFTGTDTFTYTVEDGKGGTDTAAVSVTVNAVLPPNHAPVAVPDTIAVLEGGVATVQVDGATSVLANDTDADGNTLTAVLVTGPAYGTLTLNANGTFSYLHNGSETTSDSFTYKVNDGYVDGNTVTVGIAISPVNDAPVAVDDHFSIDEDTQLVIGLPALTANDSDPEGDLVTVISASMFKNGSLSFVGGNFVFTPDAEYSGPASFEYSVHDGHGKTDSATAHIMVHAVDDPSVLLPDMHSFGEDSTGTGNVLSNDSDVDSILQVAFFEVNGDTHAAGTLITLPNMGDLSLQTDGSWRFEPVSNYNGALPTLRYTTHTGASSTLNITVTPVNDEPVALDDYLVTDADTPVEIDLATLLANDFDVDGDTLTVFAAGALANGSLSYIGGKLYFTPATGFSGQASFTYSMTDGRGATDAATVHISVNPPANEAVQTQNFAHSGEYDIAPWVGASTAFADADWMGWP